MEDSLKEGNALLKRGDYEAALAAFERAVELDEDWREKAKSDADFDPFRDDPDFRRLIYPEEFEGKEKA